MVSSLTHAFCFDALSTEIWTFEQKPCVTSVESLMDLTREVSRCTLFMLPPDYILHTLHYCSRVMVRSSSGTLLGFAFIHNERNQFVDVEKWDGTSKLTTRETGTSKADAILTHLDIFGISSFAERGARGLGRRLMQFVHNLSANFGSKVLIIEALKALEAYYASSANFCMTVPSILKASSYGCTSMIKKLDLLCANPTSTIVFDPELLTSKDIVSRFPCDFDPARLEEDFILNRETSSFLATRDPLNAGLHLKAIAQRASLGSTEYLRLWNFRTKCLSGRKNNDYDLFHVIEPF